MPREKPAHHALLPEALYTDTDIQWDNADAVPGEGVNLVVDLFDYPWQQNGADLPCDTYDVALATHLIEHIPHGVMEHGKVTNTHGGWWVWWNELARVLKPGGVVWVLSPYGVSHSGLMDPTHTRYLALETFGYFAPDPDAPFDYQLRYEWEAVAPPVVGYTEGAFQMAQFFGNTDHVTMQRVSMLFNNMISEFAIGLRVKK